MEKLSRVKKYEELRNSIETDNNIDQSVHAEAIEEPTNTLKDFDSSLFKKVEIKKEPTYTPTREKISDISEEKKNIVDDTFTNEYLDDFIKEVREYNIKKGNRESDNTQSDILLQLNSVNRAKRSHYIEDIKETVEDTKALVSKDKIAEQVQELLTEESEALPVNNANAEDDIDISKESIPEITDVDEIMENIPIVSLRPSGKKIIQPIYDDGNLFIKGNHELTAEKPKNGLLHETILEETQQLRVQMDEYEDELTDLSDGVEKNNKMLNFILCFLILVLLVIIGFVGYTIWKAGGI